MEKMNIKVPSMYADHHVLVVRDLLSQLDGVEQVYASSAFHEVVVKYDPAKIDGSKIAGVLDEAGYTKPLQVQVQGKTAEDAWKQGQFRRTQTYAADREMSSEFRTN
ncbi:MAG: heavy-metal-associated domain-containing protein [Chloroflexota bacterium]